MKKALFALAAALLLVVPGCARDGAQAQTDASSLAESSSESAVRETDSLPITEQTGSQASELSSSETTAAKETSATATEKRTQAPAKQTSAALRETTLTTATTAKTTQAAKTTTAAATTSNPAATSVHTTLKPTEITTLREQTVSVATTVKPPVTTAAPAAKITVTAYCDCKTAVSYGIREQSGYDKIIPADGVLFNTSVTVDSGSTALDALNAAAKAQGVVLNAQRGYIKSVSGLAEKACGGTSGWLYSVNGEFPNAASDKFTIKSGDTIRLLYTVKNGDVASLNWD